MARREGGGGRHRRKPSGGGGDVRHQESWGGWVSGERSIRKASGRVQIRILGRKGRESVREPTHRLERRGLKRS